MVWKNWKTTEEQIAADIFEDMFNLKKQMPFKIAQLLMKIWTNRKVQKVVW